MVLHIWIISKFRFGITCTVSKPVKGFIDRLATFHHPAIFKLQLSETENAEANALTLFLIINLHDKRN